MRKILLAVLLFATLATHAQKIGQKLSGGLNGAVGVPSGEFADANDNVAFGIRGHLMYNPSQQVPLYFGLELGLATMGSRTMRFYDSWFDTYEMTASSNIFSIQLKLRVQNPKPTLLQPFAEGLIGWNDFYSTVNIERTSYSGPGYNNSYGNSSEAQWAFTYGGAAGVGIRLNKQGNFRLEVKTAYMIGQKTKYLTDPQITGSGQVYFQENESETNMVIPQVGVKFGL